MQWWACTHSGVWKRYSGSFGERPTSSRHVPKTPTITEHGWSLLNQPQATKGCLAALGSVCLHFTYLPWPRRSVTIGVYEIGASSPFQLTRSVSRLVLITYLPNFHMVGQMQSCTIAWPPWSYIHFFFILLVLQHLFLLPTLKQWVPNGRDFVIADRLFLYCLWNPYGHSTYLLIFAVR